MRLFTPGSRHSAHLICCHLHSLPPYLVLGSATLKVLGGVLEKTHRGDEPVAWWSMEEEEPEEASAGVRTQREGFRSFVLEVTQAWNLFFNEIRGLAGPAASGTESKASL